jgi:hypothetical protein
MFFLGYKNHIFNTIIGVSDPRILEKMDLWGEAESPGISLTRKERTLFAISTIFQPLFDFRRAYQLVVICLVFGGFVKNYCHFGPPGI